MTQEVVDCCKRAIRLAAKQDNIIPETWGEEPLGSGTYNRRLPLTGFRRCAAAWMAEALFLQLRVNVDLGLDQKLPFGCQILLSNGFSMENIREINRMNDDLLKKDGGLESQTEVARRICAALDSILEMQDMPHREARTAAA